MKSMIAGMVLLSLAGAAQAQGLTITRQDVYVGAGLSSNDYEGINDKATGFQVLAGVDLAHTGQVTLGAEAGFMDAGRAKETIAFGPYRVTREASAQGFWATGVASLKLSPTVALLGRVGLDFGDDDGLMVGFGAGFPVSPKMAIRGEYVVRDHSASVQANLVYRL